MAGESRLKTDATVSSKLESDCRVEIGDLAIGFFYPLNPGLKLMSFVELFSV
jgi:hypothetical protein